MSIRKRKPFELGRYLGPITAMRTRKLEAIKQQLLELDNRLKMEMFGLRELSGISGDVKEGAEHIVLKSSKSSVSEMVRVVKIY